MTPHSYLNERQAEVISELKLNANRFKLVRQAQANRNGKKTKGVRTTKENKLCRNTSSENALPLESINIKIGQSSQNFMRQTQLIIQNQPIKTPLLNFINATALTNSPATEPREAIISVRCDICLENAQATRTALDAAGWGLYESFAFCPHHESSI